jgi:hypothetical protein
MGLKEAEGIDFKYTTMSLDDVYEVSLTHALKLIEQNGGKINGEQVAIKTQQAVPVKFEKSFTGLYPVEKQSPKWTDKKDEFNFDFEGTGFVIKGESASRMSASEFVFNAELYVDGNKIEAIKLPVNYTTRRYEIGWKYDLPKGKHSVRFKLLNPSNEYAIQGVQAIIYSDQPVNGFEINNKKQL